MGVLAVLGAWRGMRLAARLALLALVVVVAYVAVTAVQVVLTSRQSRPGPAQAIVVMGAAQYNGVPSPDLRARLQEAADLYRRGLAPLVVATGYKQAGDAYTESEASGTWLRQNGVPGSAIIEVGGSDSWENLADAAAALRSRGALQVLLVTDGFHEDRSLAIAAGVGLRAEPVPTTDSPIQGWSAWPYFAKETLGVALGRIVGYSHLHSLGARVGVR
ncbi:MAG TPA: YdcF family protein [Acidimicrobiales bacterium]|nr:YdcF family protein [Acidimicrobiales bacterium]